MTAHPAKFLVLVAMVPAAVNPALLPGENGVIIALCGGDGAGPDIRIPLGPQKLPGENNSGCCAKACHSSGNRKRVSGTIS